jgi:hypothetical protein
MKTSCLISTGVFTAVASFIKLVVQLEAADAPVSPAATFGVPALVGSISVFSPTPAIPLPANRGAPSKHLGHQRVQPGIYEAAPFTAIVVIPRIHPDELRTFQPRSRGAPNGKYGMPVIKPELKLIPRTQK